MARTQAADYDRRREAIRVTAARLYAERGFLGASVAQIAAGCETSKSLIYHYYPSKEDILFDVVDSHVQALTEVAREAEESGGDAEARIRRLSRALMAAYEGAGDRQKVLLNDVANLPADRRAEIVEHQRELLDIVDRLLLAARPALADRRERRRAITMIYFGMLNWTHTWFDPAGRLAAETVADMATAMLLRGLDEAAA